MPPFDQHLLSFVIRCIHVMSMAFMLGGAILCWGLSRPSDPPPEQYPRLLLFVTQKYEFFFWTTIGIQIITGIGNIGAIGTGLLGTNSSWGLKLTIKLFAFLLLMLLSLPRTTFNARLNPAQEPAASIVRPTVFRALYASTSLYIAGIVVLAVSLAHG